MKNKKLTLIGAIFLSYSALAQLDCNTNLPGWGKDLGTVSFHTTKEWVITGNGISQTWSDAVTATGCQKTNFNSGLPGNFHADCRSNPGRPGDLFSWCAVVRFADKFCPHPWRVPTQPDLIGLDIAMGGSGENRFGDAQFVRDNYIGRWGGTFGGDSEPGGKLTRQDTVGLYWSSFEISADEARDFCFRASGSVNPQCGTLKNRGFALRCVRTTLLDVNVSANPSIGGRASGGGTGIAYGTSITVIATPNPGYDFINWTENGQVVSTSASYTFTVTASQTLVANFTPTIIHALPPIIIRHPQFAVYLQDEPATPLTVAAISPDGGVLTYQWFSNTTNNTRSGTAINGATTASFTPSTATVGAMFYYVVVTNTINDNGDGGRKTATATSFVAQIIVMPLPEFDLFCITVSAYPPTAGSATGGQANIARGTRVAVLATATANECWQFVNWTINDVEISTESSLAFLATEPTDLVANFEAIPLDFDTYASTLWNNTFMLNLNKLRAHDLEALDAHWFRNGVKITNTRTGSPFSYSEGPIASDKLESAPVVYHFEILTKRCGMVVSTPKTIPPNNFAPVETQCIASLHAPSLHAFPNPIQTGKILTIENTTEGHQIQIFNRSGTLVKSAIATNNTTQLTLNIPQGTYVIHVDGKTIQILVTE